MQTGNITDIRLAVKKSPLYRAPLTVKPLAAGSTVLLAGDPSSFSDAMLRLNSQGYHVKAAIQPSENLIKMPPGIDAVTRDKLPRKLPYPVVFSGVPRKHQFSSNREYGKQVCWLDADLVPKQKSRLADREILERFSSQIEVMFADLADEESRKTLQSILASRYFNNNGYLRIAPYAEYSHPLAKIRRGDVVVDAGAHVGKISRLFANACGSDGIVYSFEPDPDNFAAMTDRNSKNPQVVPVKAGVWSKTTTLSFDNTVQSSAGHALSEEGAIKVPVVSLDDFFSEESRRAPTVIKFDIEGAEANALAGAEKTIRDHKPRLMISAYHKRKDLWQLLLQVKKIRPDYNFHLGHHNFYHTETDIYAV